MQCRYRTRRRLRPGLSSSAIDGVSVRGPRKLLSVITVDGQTFEIYECDGQYEYDWKGGRHEGDYGFVCKTSTGTPPLTDEDHREAVVSFLADVDPQTGYLE